ncbi:MAG: GIY-YIG nuclease family protein [Firmicutes bacterium]|nr:GIY-YIG nuclease family protein [Bacillota bacterium]MDY5530691.1 GIY-YIG nuclease family protein [Pumilibacteraceae bacterium]
MQTDLIGRAFVYYKKDFRASSPGLDLIPQSGSMAPRDAYIVSLLAKKTSINDFPGFDNVNIDYEMLESIVREEISTWKTALSNVMGIYLISDKLTGKQYVGSAYGDDCIWHRWSAYAANGHEGNVELKELLSSNGENYKYNFKYSILEVCNMNLGSEYVIGRETHWKEVLQTRMFGLNKN